MSEREQADRWWDGKTPRQKICIARRNVLLERNDLTSAEWWWRSMTNEGAVAIYKQESGE